VYRSAVREPEKFFIGLDANARPLAKVSERIYRRAERGGAPNALFVQAAVENLPEELNAVAGEIHVQFPWGSLLRAVATGEEVVLNSLHGLCRSHARLQVTIGFDPARDRSALKRLGLTDLSATYLERELVSRYEANGFKMEDCGILSSAEWPEIESSWAAKLRRIPTRKLIYLRAMSDKL
jgi:16S rRNA (adenine(1408)-N(1))-methyltransferase